jgi:colanic acid/amylovoran biosynthesis protein
MNRTRHGLVELARQLGYAHRVLAWDLFRLRVAAGLARQGFNSLARLAVSGEEWGSLREYLQADLIISSGGTYLVEHYDLLPSILDYELTLALEKPLVFFPQSLGPFEKTRYRRRLRRIFEAASLVMVRDERSASHIRDLGVSPQHLRVYPDAAFALHQARDPLAHSPGSPLHIAVSVRTWRHFSGSDPSDSEAQYFRMVAAGITRLVRNHGAQVTFLSTCQGLPEYWADDSRTAESVTALLDRDVMAHVWIDSTFRQPGELLTELTKYDAIIATRMHMAILGICAGVPALPIAYEFKTRELFRELGLEEWVTDIEDADEAVFSELVDRFVNALATVTADLTSELPRVRAQLADLSKQLRVVFSSARSRP